MCILSGVKCAGFERSSVTLPECVLMLYKGPVKNMLPEVREEAIEGLRASNNPPTYHIDNFL